MLRLLEISKPLRLYFSKLLRLLWILDCYIACGSSFFFLCSFSLSVHYACECTCTSLKIEDKKCLGKYYFKPN